MGHLATKQELVAILRRFDMDGDAKINFKEFELGMKSSTHIFNNDKKRRPKSSNLKPAIIVSKSKPLFSTPSYKDITPPRPIKKLSRSFMKSAGRKRPANTTAT